MKEPITWKTVNAPDFGKSAAMKVAASQQFNTAFDGADRIQQAFAARGERVEDNNTEAFKNLLLQRYQSPEALGAAQASGEIDQLRQQFGNTDTSQTGFSGIQSLIGQQRKAVNDRQTYEDGRAAISDRNSLAYAQKLMAEGNNAGALGFAEQQRRAGIMSNQGFSGFATALGEERDADELKDSDLATAASGRATAASNRATAGLTRQVTRNSFNQTLQTQQRAEVDRQLRAAMAEGTDEGYASARALIDGSSTPAAFLQQIRDAETGAAKTEIGNEVVTERQARYNANAEAEEALNAIRMANPEVAAMEEDPSLQAGATREQLALLNGMALKQEGMYVDAPDQRETKAQVITELRNAAEQSGKNVDEGALSIQADAILKGAESSITLTPDQERVFAARETALEDLKSKNQYATDSIRNFTQGERMKRISEILGYEDMKDLQGKWKGAFGTNYDEFMGIINRGTIDVMNSRGKIVPMELTMPVIEHMAGTADKGYIFTDSPKERGQALADAGFFDEEALDNWGNIQAEEKAIREDRATAPRPGATRSANLDAFNFGQRLKNLPVDSVTTATDTLIDDEGAVRTDAKPEEMVSAMVKLKSALKSAPEDLSGTAHNRASIRYKALEEASKKYTAETRSLKKQLRKAQERQALFDPNDNTSAYNWKRLQAEIESLQRRLEKRPSMSDAR